jgi:eukaryotic-like serine/threonine-protein kinase
MGSLYLGASFMSDQVIRIRDIELREGTNVAERYEIVRHLGTGGFAQVFEAFDSNIERPVAIKFLNLHTTQTNPDASDNILARFKREAKLAARIQHPNVVNIFDFGTIGRNRDVPYIVMELLSGHDLEVQIFERGPMEPSRALPLFVHCLEALGEAHEMGIVHKDLKPSNLFLSNPGERTESLRIVDFGIAHLHDAREGRLTATGEILGTPQYLSPEYIESQLVTPAFDVYQMALILVEMLTGSPVVDENHPLRCVKVHSLGELDLPSPLLESPLGPVVAQALHINHEERFSDANAFADALSQVDPQMVPALSPDTPTSRLSPGTYDSNSQIMNSHTGQVRRPNTGQMGQNPAGGHTQPGYPEPFENEQASTTPGIGGPEPGTSAPSQSTQAAIAEAGIGSRGIKALALLILAVLALGGVAAWLLVTKLSDDEPAVAEATTEEVPESDHNEPTDDEPPAADDDGADQPDDSAVAAVDDQQTDDGDEAVDPPQPVEVNVVSIPGGATVKRGSEKLGTAPVSIEFASADDEPVELRLSRRGYKSSTVTVGPDADKELLVELERKRRKSTRSETEKTRAEEPRAEETSSATTDLDESTSEGESASEEADTPTQRLLIAP